MMLERILILFACVTLLGGCKSDTPEIRTLCLRDDIGNYIIKWETDPHMDGMLKMYVSDNPETFDRSLPAGYANINDGVTTYITNDNITRKYFQLSFNDKCFQTVGSRAVTMDNVQNLRDIGGYFTPDKKMTHWGKVYRSGELSSVSEWDSIRLDNLHIKTIIDLRDTGEVTLKPSLYKHAKITCVPIPFQDLDLIKERLVEGRMRKGDGLLFMQDTYLRFITRNSESFAKALRVFLNEENYPILVNCSLGKDRTGFLTAMLLTSLGIEEESVKKDYMASNEYIDISHLAYMARGFNTDAQETITVLVSVNETFLDLVFNKIKKEYGSIDKYLSKGLHLTDKDREKLKDILLY